MKVVIASSARETEAAGAELLAWLGEADSGARVLLRGELGAGKTTMVRGLAAALGVAPEDVNSPTFALLNEYEDPLGALRLRHLDLYRVEDLAELAETGILDLDGEVPLVIEWPRDLVEPEPGDVEVQLEVLEDGRRIAVRRVGS